MFRPQHISLYHQTNHYWRMNILCCDRGCLTYYFLPVDFVNQPPLDQHANWLSSGLIYILHDLTSN